MLEWSWLAFMFGSPFGWDWVLLFLISAGMVLVCFYAWIPLGLGTGFAARWSMLEWPWLDFMFGFRLVLVWALLFLINVGMVLACFLCLAFPWFGYGLCCALMNAGMVLACLYVWISIGLGVGFAVFDQCWNGPGLLLCLAFPWFGYGLRCILSNAGMVLSCLYFWNSVGLGVCFAVL